MKISEIIDDNNELIGSNDSPSNGSDLETRVGKKTTDTNRGINTQNFSWNSFATFFGSMLYEDDDNEKLIENSNKLRRLIYSTFGDFLNDCNGISYDKLDEDKLEELSQLTKEFVIQVDEIMNSEEPETIQEDEIVQKSIVNNTKKDVDDLIQIKKQSNDIYPKNQIKVITKGSIIDSINEENSKLAGKKYMIPKNILQYIADAKSRYKNQDGLKRANDKLENEYLTYESMKRLLNFFKNANQDSSEYHLAGGGLMYSFVVNTLQSERERVKKSEISNDINDNINANIDKINTNNSGYRKLNF